MAQPRPSSSEQEEEKQQEAEEKQQEARVILPVEEEEDKQQRKRGRQEAEEEERQMNAELKRRKTEWRRWRQEQMDRASAILGKFKNEKMWQNVGVFPEKDA
jgi:hypothetical protein